MSTTAIATAADYADAMLIARRAKNVFVLALLLLLLAQITVFCLVQFKVIKLDALAIKTDVLTSSATTLPTVVPASGITSNTPALLDYATGLMLFAGIALALVLAAVLMLLVKIMLVGRLIGAGQVTSAYVLSLLLIVFIFPWQFFLTNALQIPGVLYTWNELTEKAPFPNSLDGNAKWVTVLGWFRFVVAPLIAIVFLLLIQKKSNRGLRMALGEDDVTTIVNVETV